MLCLCKQKRRVHLDCASIANKNKFKKNNITNYKWFHWSIQHISIRPSNYRSFAYFSREGSQNPLSRHPTEALYGDPSKHYSRSLLGVNSECRQLALTPYCPHSDLPLNKTLPGSIACTTATQPQQTTWAQDGPPPSHNPVGIVPAPLIDPKKYLTPDHFYEATGWPRQGQSSSGSRC